MLSNPQIWKKWASRDQTKIGPWAPLPQRPVVTDVVPSSQHQPQTWSYTIDKPANDWTQPTFDASAWKQGPGGFGSRGTPGAVVGTEWKSDDIWIRREFVMPEGEHPDLQLIVYHDEDVEIYLNGVLAASESDFVNSYEPMDISNVAMSLLKPGAKITMAVHCHQTKGGQGVDVGLVDVVEGKKK